MISELPREAISKNSIFNPLKNNLDEINNSVYTDNEWEDAVDFYKNSIPSFLDYEVVDGRIINITKKGVLVNIGYKSEGLIPTRELKSVEYLKPGSILQVYIESRENKDGKLVLSYSKARIIKTWERLKDSLENHTVLESIVQYCAKGGLVVDIDDVKCFLPITQIDYRPVSDLDAYVGKAIDVVVLKINKFNNNVVVSHKSIIEKGLESQRATIMGSLEKGAILEGVVKNIASFGVFVDLGGLDGLLHKTDICWQRIPHPSSVLKIDQKVNVLVLDFDEEHKRVSLGMKQLTPHPWDKLPETFSVGTKVRAKVVCKTDYGIFVEIVPGVEGLIHSAEMTWSFHSENPANSFSLGDEIEAVIILIDRENKKLALSIKKLATDPWKNPDIISKYKVGSRHRGMVKNLASFGAFIELEPGIDGLLYVSNIYWDLKVNHPSEFVKPGHHLEVQILGIEPESRRLSLGMKQIMPNPYEVHANSLQPGSVVKGIVTKFIGSDKRALIKLEYGIGAFANKNHIIKENGKPIQLGENLEFTVLSFDPTNCEIYVYYGNKKLNSNKKDGNKPLN